MKSLKKPTANQKGLKKLPRAVRNKMGYAKDGMKYKNGGKSDPKKTEAKADPRKAPKVASKKSPSESLSTQVKRKIKKITGSKGLFPGVKMKNGGKIKKLGKRGAVGAPVSNKSVKKYGKMATGSQMDTALRVPKARFSESGNLEIGSKRDGRVQSNAKDYLKSIQKSQEVPNKALKKVTKKFNTGRAQADKRTYYQGNPGGLKKR